MHCGCGQQVCVVHKCQTFRMSMPRPPTDKPVKSMPVVRPLWINLKGMYLPVSHTPACLPAAPGVLVLRCGPLPMMMAMKEHLITLGYTEEMMFNF